MTEEAFERDIASFDACGQPLSDKFSSPAKDHRSPITCKDSFENSLPQVPSRLVF